MLGVCSVAFKLKCCLQTTGISSTVWIYLDGYILTLSGKLSIVSADGKQPRERAAFIYRHLLDRLIIDWGHAYERLQTSDPYNHSEALPHVASVTCVFWLAYYCFCLVVFLQTPKMPPMPVLPVLLPIPSALLLLLKAGHQHLCQQAVMWR